MSTKKTTKTEWITQAELCRRWNVSRARVNNWISRGKIDSKPLKGTHLVLVNPASLQIKLK